MRKLNKNRDRQSTPGLPLHALLQRERRRAAALSQRVQVLSAEIRRLTAPAKS